MTTKKLISLLTLLIVCLIIYFSDFDPNVKKGLTIFSVAAILWMTETLHLTATALLIPVLSVALGVFPVNQALDSFSHPIVFIFLGGFTLATALRKQRLDEVIAHIILACSKGHTSLAVYLLFGLTAVLFMWVSNTAITAVMLPLALGIIASLKLSQGPTSLFVLLGIAYSASIGGGLALSGVLKTTGTSAFIAENFASYMQGMSFMLFLVMVILFVIFLTELTSNTATAALLFPLFISISDQLSLPSDFIAMGIGLAASCAFMLPVATPPNAVVYGSGLVPQSEMMRAGIFLNLVASASLPFLIFIFMTQSISKTKGNEFVRSGSNVGSTTVFGQHSF